MSKRPRNTRPASPGAQGAPSPSRPASTAPAGTPDPSASRPGAAPAPRRTRSAAPVPRSPLERYRGAIIGVVVVAILVGAGAFVFLGASSPAYACSTILQPEPTASAAPDATPRLGQATRDLGRTHVDVGERVRYDFCPPTSGSHYNDSRYGPIATRVYGPDDANPPQGWVHNLEHGQMVVLYRCPEGCDETAQAALQALQRELPASPLCALPATDSVTVTRLDDLPTPYAAVVWGRVLFLDTLDATAIATFQQQSADRGPEPQCQNAVPGASPSTAPSASPSASPAQ